MDAYDLITSGAQIRKLITKYVEPIMQEYDLRPVELDILEFITRENLTTSKEIMLRRHISKSHISKSHISKSLDHLLEKGFINMTEDENDHRIMRITLTQDSYKVISRVNDVYEQCKDVLLRGISDEEMHIFRKVIHKMNNNVDEELLM